MYSLATPYASNRWKNFSKISSYFLEATDKRKIVIILEH